MEYKKRVLFIVSREVIGLRRIFIIIKLLDFSLKKGKISELRKRSKSPTHLLQV